jgi:putative Holliday junction resolvase
MRVLGLDLGSRTIGLALSDELGVVASPLCSLPRHGGNADVEALRAVVAETGARSLVVGLPLELDGSAGGRARRAVAFGQRVGAALGLPVHSFDERFSTTAAERALLEADLGRQRRRQLVDSVAAALILQAYLDAHRQDDNGEPGGESDGEPGGEAGDQAEGRA